MSEARVVNASPLILSSRIDRLDSIEHLAPAILIPNAVIDEVRAGQHRGRAGATALAWAGKYRVEDMAVVTSVEHWDLGLGEALMQWMHDNEDAWQAGRSEEVRPCRVRVPLPVGSQEAVERHAAVS